MASPPHDIFAELFRIKPRLAPDLLKHLRVPLPSYDTVEPIDQTDREPVSTERRSDLVLLFKAGGATVFTVVLEVQLAKDDDKHWRWPGYVTSARDRHRCPAALVVVTPDEAVARWAGARIDLGPGSWVQPVVLDPRAVPRLDALPPAERTAGAAMLSVGLHVRSFADSPIVKAALDKGLPSVDDFGGERTYNQWLQALLLPELRRALEQEVEMGVDVSDIVPLSELIEKRGRRLGREEGREEGREKGLAAQRRTFLLVADARGIAVSSGERAMLERCTDSDTLARWTASLVGASSVSEALVG
ncbi:MAG: hypothetical protein RL199_674 [Pseudomonadota bacterium]|jgi:hypothetical protein